MRYMALGNGWASISSDIMYHPTNTFLYITTDDGIAGFYVDDCDLVEQVHVFMGQ